MQVLAMYSLAAKAVVNGRRNSWTVTLSPRCCSGNDRPLDARALANCSTSSRVPGRNASGSSVSSIMLVVAQVTLALALRRWCNTHYFFHSGQSCGDFLCAGQTQCAHALAHGLTAQLLQGGARANTVFHGLGSEEYVV